MTRSGQINSPNVPVFLLLAMTAMAQTPPAHAATAQLSANDANQLFVSGPSS